MNNEWQQFNLLSHNLREKMQFKCSFKMDSAVILISIMIPTFKGEWYVIIRA